MQLKFIKQELLNIKSWHKATHKGIISLALAVNRAKGIADNFNVEDKFKKDDYLAEKLALKLSHYYSEKGHEFSNKGDKNLTK